MHKPSMTVPEIYDSQARIMSMRTSGKKHVRHQIISNIIFEAKNKLGLIRAVLSLAVVFPCSLSFKQRQEIYKVLAMKMSQCSRAKHLDLVDFILVNGYDSVLLSMCWVLRGEWGIEQDKVALTDKWNILREQGLSGYFQKKKKAKRKRNKFRLARLAA